jgi:Protein of unknown function (DUF3052)
MGYDAACTLRFEGRSVRGKAVLEQHELIVRGAERVVIPIRDVTSAIAKDGSLTIHFGRKTAVLELGPVAAKWAKRIMNPPSRIDKLGAKAGMSVLIAGARHADLVGELNALGVRVTARAGDSVDLIFYGAESRDALTRLKDLRHTLKPDGALWVIRPKGSKVITEAEVMSAGKHAGLVDVKVASFSETHTAEKFVIPRAAR